MDGSTKSEHQDLKGAVRDAEYKNQFSVIGEARELRNFLSQDVFKTTPGDPRTNIFEPGCGTYCFANDENLVEFFDKLEACRRKGVELRFFEKQEYTLEDGVIQRNHTGIMLDFDILQSTRDVQWQTRRYYEMTQRIIDLISEMIDLPAMDIYIIFLRKPSIEPKVDKVYGKIYKDGFHMLIPSIQVTKSFKKFLIKRIREGDFLERSMRGINLVTPVEEVLDSASSTVPVQLYGCTRAGRPTYVLDCALKIQYEDNSVYNPQIEVHHFNPDIIKSTRKTEKDKYRWKTNVTMEFSLGYSYPGGFIEKREFDPNERFADEINRYNERNAGPVIINEDEQAEIDNDLSIMSMNDPQVAIYKNLISILDVDKRLRERKDWVNFVRMIANMSPNYKSLAIYGSHRCPEKWTKGGLDELNRLWTEFTTIRQNQNVEVLSERTLHFWAQKDNPEKYKEVISNTAWKILADATFAYHGVIEQAIVADILQAMFGNKFTCIVDPNTKNSTRRIWFEFVIPTDKKRPGEVYKYREEGTPDTLSRYMSKTLPKLYDMVIDYLRGQMGEMEEDVERNKLYKSMVKKLYTSKTNLLKDGFQNGVIRQCEKKFRDYGLYDRLDKNENILGVGNGVLKLGRRCELINRFHEYPISKYTQTNFIKYDPNNPDIKLLEKAINDLFPKEEIDARDFIMYYLASTLDSKPKEGILFLWLGGGCNGKSFLLELHRNMLGEMYGVKLPLSLLTQPRPPAEKPNDALTKLEYAKYVYFSEPDPGLNFYMGPIKEMTGGEAIYVRGLHKEGRYITPKTHYTVAGNHRISIRGNDHGTWRRIKKYGFKITFRDPHEYNEHNPYEKLKDDRFIKEVKHDPRYHSAWLAILSHWYEKLQQKYNGKLSNIPHPTIVNETIDYRNEEDTINKFITSRLVEDPDAEDITLEELCRKYTEWHESNIKRERFIMSEIREAFKNSAIQNNIIIRLNNEFLTGYRIRDFSNMTRECQPDEPKPKDKGKEKIDDDEYDEDDTTDYLK